MRIGPANALPAMILAGALGAGGIYFVPGMFRSGEAPPPVIEGVRSPQVPDEEPRTVALAIRGDRPTALAAEVAAVTPPAPEVAAATPPAPADTPHDPSPQGNAPPTDNPSDAEADDDGDVTPTLE